MIILHGALLDGGLYLWGERASDAAAPVKKKRGRKPLRPPVPASPYDAGARALTQALEHSGIPVQDVERRAALLTLALPSCGDAPLPSSPLIAEIPPPLAGAALRPWTVTAVRLEAREAENLLCRCAELRMPAPGVMRGEDLAFWSRLFLFASSLVARQHFIPDVRSDGGAWKAAWAPVLRGADGERVAELAASMPGACRAAAWEKTPVETARAFLDAAVDALVRHGGDLPAGKRRYSAAGGARSDVLHDRWLTALTTDEKELRGTEKELAAFCGQVKEWSRRVTLESSAPFRLCFRLEEPSKRGPGRPKKHDSPDGWTVRHLLQAADDPSLLIPVEDAWNAAGAGAKVFRSRNVSPRELILTSLGRATGICPSVGESLKESLPWGFRLPAAGAWGFLIEAAPALQDAGFRVLLPSWWTGADKGGRLSVRAKSRGAKLSPGAAGLAGALHFDWEVAVGDQALTLSELEDLARLKVPLVRLRGQWVHFDPADLGRIVAMVRRGEKMPAADALKMALGAAPLPDTVRFDGLALTGWMKELVDRLGGGKKLEELAPPREFSGSLRPYQVKGYSWLDFLARWGLGACLADDMGLGKTVQALALIARLREKGEHGPVLIVCPTSVAANWQKEAAHFTPALPVMLHHGTERGRGESFAKKAEQHAVVITSYALLHRDTGHLKSVAWSGVILDEAQNIKNAETLQSRAARGLKARYRIALTGTPVENHVGDLWSIMEFLNPGFLGSAADFRRRFLIPIHSGAGCEEASLLKRLTAPFILRRLKTDKAIISDLPEKMEANVLCTLTKEQASLYRAVVKEAEGVLDEAEGIQRRGMILAALTKLKQVCNHPAHFLSDGSPLPGRSGKLSRLTEMCEEVLESGGSALIFSQFAGMGELIRRHLQETFGVEALFLHGGVERARRAAMVERFQGDAGPPFFVLSLKAGGTGLNLTRANNVIHFDRWWNPAVESQATDRAFRIGQRRNVQVYKFICAGTLEERIDRMMESKKALAEEVIGAGEGWLTELSTRELKALMALQRESVAE